jgi:hypothetical protein
MDLAWRRPEPREQEASAAHATTARMRRLAPVMTEQPGSSAVLAAPLTMEPPRHTTAPAPELTEQLTREVVRRIERQLRIERERRGI